MPRPAARRHATPPVLPPVPSPSTSLATAEVPVLASTLPAHTPRHTISLAIALHPQRILPEPTLLAASRADLTLVEHPATGRLRILFGDAGGWVEVPLEAFGTLVECAQAQWDAPLVIPTTVALVLIPSVASPRPSMSETTTPTTTGATHP
jgi:hypothetical protein